MIDKKELRIGNWIFCKSTKKPIKINGIYSNGDIEISSEFDSEEKITSYDVEPLYLNQELLNHIASQDKDDDIYYFFRLPLYVAGKLNFYGSF